MSRDLPDPMKDPVLRRMLEQQQADPWQVPAVETITQMGMIKAAPASGPQGRGAAILVRTGRQDIRQYQFPMGLAMAKGLHSQLGAVIEQQEQAEQTDAVAQGNGKPTDAEPEPEADASE